MITPARRDAPSDEQLLALGRLAVESGRLDINIQILASLMAGIYPISSGFAGAITRDLSTFAMRKVLITLSIQLWGVGAENQIRVAKLADKYREHATRRGNLIHAFWTTPSEDGHSTAMMSKFHDEKGTYAHFENVRPADIEAAADRAKRLSTECHRLTDAAIQGYADFARSLRDRPNKLSDLPQ